MFDLILFDLDGTLTDSIHPALLAIQEMLAVLKYQHKTTDEIKQYVGFGEVPLVEGAIGTNNKKLVREAMEVYLSIYKKKWLKNLPLYPNVKETLLHFNSKKMAIVSNKASNLIEMILANHGIRNLFIRVYGGDNSPCLKPDPCVVKMLIAETGIPKSNVLFVGDMAVDIKTAKRSGIKSCAVSYGFDPVEDLIREKPDFLINDFVKILDIV